MIPRAPVARDAEYYAQYGETQHLIVPIKFIGSSQFVDTDLADIEEEKWFRPVARLTGTWKDPIPFLPYQVRASMCTWRELMSVFIGLEEVFKPRHM